MTSRSAHCRRASAPKRAAAVWRENAIELYDLPSTRSTERWEPIGLGDQGTVGDTKAAAIAGNTAHLEGTFG